MGKEKHYKVCNCDNLNLRSRRSMISDILGVLAAGYTFRGIPQGEWIKVLPELGNKVGYVKAEFVEEVDDGNEYLGNTERDAEYSDRNRGI